MGKTRRSKMKIKLLSSVVAATFAFSSSALFAAGELNIFNWGNYTPPDLIEKFENLEGWEKTQDEREAYEKLFKFSDFKQAFSFMTCIAMKAEQINHHPEWENVYNKVKITLTTHDVGGISKLDYDMALFADVYSQNFNK